VKRSTVNRWDKRKQEVTKDWKKKKVLEQTARTKRPLERAQRLDTESDVGTDALQKSHLRGKKQLHTQKKNERKRTGHRTRRDPGQNQTDWGE